MLSKKVRNSLDFEVFNHTARSSGETTELNAPKPNGSKALSEMQMLIPAPMLDERKRKNPTPKPPRTPRPFSPKLIAEFNTAFVEGLNALHGRGLPWIAVSKICGLGISHIKRIRSGECNANLPAFIHLADALNVSLVELLCMGQNE